MVTIAVEGSKELYNDNFYMRCEKSVSQIADGDISALTQLYNCLKRPVFMLAYSIVADYPLAEDITQETFLRVNDKASAYHPGTNPKAWIFKIARNLAIDAIRSRSREDLHEVEPERESENIEDIVVGGDGFSRAMTNLDSTERDIVVLKIGASLKHSEIAKIIGISTGNVRIRYFRALKKLKSYYEDKL